MQHEIGLYLLHATFFGKPMRSEITYRVEKHRQGLRAAGLRPLQIWVPDTRKPGFAEECRRQSLSLRDDPHEAETLDFLDAAADRDGWE